MTPSLIALAGLTLMLSACNTSSKTALRDEAPPVPVATTTKGQVKVTIRGFRNHKGQALASLFAGPKGFPNKGDLAMKRLAREIGEDEMLLVFKDVPSGSYAVAILHDEDMNFKMKTGTFGIPKEGYGVSNNAKGRFGPPKYKDAEFKLEKGHDVALTIKLIYH